MPRRKRPSAIEWWPRNKLDGYRRWARRRDRFERIILHAQDCPLGDECDCSTVTLEHGAEA